MRSHIAYPAPNAVDTAKAHGAPLGEDEVRATKEVMGFDPELKFHVDARVYEHMSLRGSGRGFQEEWEGRAKTWSERYPHLIEEWERAWSGRLREGWQDALPSFEAGEEIATRSAGQKTMSTISAYGPTMAGGAADLVESTKTTFEGAGEFSHVHVGAQHPLRHPRARDGGDRQRAGRARRHGQALRLDVPCLLRLHARIVRLSALMELPVLWVWTHDSVGLGEDGPTHQPVEHYAALRAIPQLWVMRPADANETVQAWKLALEREDGPVALLLSRQNLLVLDREQLSGAEGLAQGAYVLWESAGAPQLVLIATGSEVAPTLRGRSRSGGGGHARTRRLDAVHGTVRSAAGRVPRQHDPARAAAPGRRGRRQHELVEVGR